MDTKNDIKWDIDVSILTNRFILKELLKVLGIATFVTVAIVLLITLPSILGGDIHSNSSNARDMKYALTLIGMLFFFTALFIFVYYGNMYMLSYSMDSKSVSTISRTEQRGKNSKLNFLLIIIGLLARNPTATGIGFLASSHQDQNLKWKNIKKATFHPDSSTVTLSAGYGEKSIVFCTDDNYDEVSGFIRSMCSDSCHINEK
ncbi:hypothetical protein RE476_11690 [Methanolobus mangrovi]|uniref:Uncharacterized protein n=1 Tax=Methanolobus mangrovi TaxID=3072977 RepID=A0AA51UF09_9EURY|nr:hypothetical protein [Methanolobus mangrovi]WMW22019.1 hypothetical protein RE476_11690 [Methanolobus mangrovi]